MRHLRPARSNDDRCTARRLGRAAVVLPLIVALRLWLQLRAVGRLAEARPSGLQDAGEEPWGMPPQPCRDGRVPRGVCDEREPGSHGISTPGHQDRTLKQFTLMRHGHLLAIHAEQNTRRPHTHSVAMRPPRIIPGRRLRGSTACESVVRESRRVTHTGDAYW